MINTVSRKKDYSDLDLNFMPHPTTKDVMKKTGAEPFQPYIGSNALKLLFDNATPITANFLNNAILEVIRNFEPRIRVDDLRVTFDYDNNGYNATLYFTILNRNEPAVINLFLERIR